MFEERYRKDGVAGPIFIKGQQMLVNDLLASHRRRLPVSNTNMGEGEGRTQFTMGDNVLWL